MIIVLRFYDPCQLDSLSGISLASIEISYLPLFYLFSFNIAGFLFTKLNGINKETINYPHEECFQKIVYELSVG